MDYTSLSWNDVRLHEFAYPLSIMCYECTLVCSVCTDCRLFLLCSLMSCHHVWHMTGWGCDQHDECHLWTRTLFTILSFCVQSSFSGVTVSNVDYRLPFVLSPFDLCPSVWCFWLQKCCLPTFLMLIGSQIVIVFSTYFIFCSSLHSNQITLIQSGIFNDMTSLTHL